MQFHASTEGGATNGTKVLSGRMMGKVEGGRVLDEEDGSMLGTALERSLSMRLKNRGRGDALRAPEAVGGFSSSPGAGGLGHTGGGMGTQLCHKGGQATSEAVVSELGSFQFVNGPVRWLWSGAGKSFHTGVSVPTRVRPVDLWVMHRAEAKRWRPRNMVIDVILP